MQRDGKLITSSDDVKPGQHDINRMNYEEDQSEFGEYMEWNSGHWNDKESAKYFAFLDKFRDRFVEKESRRECKIFKVLSRFIKTRNANQCRSHHHKMKRNFKTIQQTLFFLKKRNPFLEAESKKYALQLSNIKIQTIVSGELDQTQNPKRSSWNHQQEGLKYRFYPEQSQKLQNADFSNFPTQVSYFEQGEINLSPGNYFNNYQQNNYKLFPESLTTNIHNSSYLDAKQRIREKGWIQAHQIFTRWINKVKTLIN